MHGLIYAENRRQSNKGLLFLHVPVYFEGGVRGKGVAMGCGPLPHDPVQPCSLAVEFQAWCGDVLLM